MAGKRQSRFERLKKPSPIILQPRDREIMLCVHEFRFLTREQIQRLFDFNCVTRANIRLRKLYDHGYLSRHFLPTVRGSSRAVYFLGPKGMEIISEGLGLDISTLKLNRKGFKDLFLNHQLALNEARIAITLTIKEKAQMSLDCWLNEDACLQEYGRRRGIIRPDAYFRFFNNGRIYSFFLEVDRSTMSHSRFRLRIQSYLEYAQSGYYQARYGVRYFRVLIITITLERLFNLKRLIEGLTNKIFWFTTMDQIRSRNVFQSIWYRAGRDGLFPLVEE